MTTEQVLKVSTLEAVKNVTDLKNNISELKRVINGWTEVTEEGGKKVVKTFQGLTIGSKEYQQAVQQLNENQAALRNAMHGTAASLDEVREAAKGASKEEIQLDAATGKLVTDNDAALQSYNGLVKTLANLKEEWRATTDETERATLGEKINAVNNKLKELDASVGVYGRNVGSYQNVVDHLGNSFTATAGGAAKMINPIKNATTGLKALSTTPVIAILGLLANVLNKIIGSLKSSEENTQKLTKAMAPFEAIGDALTKMLQAAGAALVAVVGWIGKLTEALIGNNKAAEKRLAIAKAQAELDQAQRETLIKNAEAERDIAELRAKSSDKEQYTATQRLAFLEKAGRLEAEIAARAVADARKHYQIVAARNKLSKSSKEQLQEEAQAYADMVKAETAYYNQVRTINAGITRARREETREARETAKAVKDAATAKISAEKDYLTQLLSIVKTGTESEFKIQNSIARREYELAVANAKQKITDTKELNKALALLQKSFNVQLQKNQQDHDNKVLEEELQSIANRRDALQRGSVEYAQVQKEYAERALDGMRQQMDETDAEFQARKLEAQRTLAEASNALTDAVAKETADGLKAEMAALREGSVEQLALALELAKKNLENTYQGIDESLDEYNRRRLEAEKAVRVAEDNLSAGQIDADRVLLEQRMAGLEEGSIEYLTRALELKQFELDSLHQYEGESNEEFRLRELQAEKEAAEARKDIWKASIAMMQQAAGGVSGILGSIADMYESNTEMSEEEAKKVKNLRIAGATIDMFQGAVTAYAGAQSLGVPLGPIIGAINAAAVIATGMANIAKIRATDINKNSAGGTATASVPATVQAPTVVPQVQETRTITSASEEDRLNQMASEQRVYILSSDLEADREQTRARVAETTF